MVGYFGIRKVNLDLSEVERYHIHQKVDQLNGLHEEVQLLTRAHRTIILAKIAYEKNYWAIREMCESRFEFLGYKKLKYGELLGKLIPLVFLVSGVLAGPVGILQLIK